MLSIAVLKTNKHKNKPKEGLLSKARTLLGIISHRKMSRMKPGLQKPNLQNLQKIS
jgi:hypothetical protein